MRFWDTSAVVPLLVAELSSKRMVKLLVEDPAVFIWWGTPLESLSAVARKERGGEMNPMQAEVARDNLSALTAGWTEVAPGEAVRDVAARLIRVHDLRAADGLQLAAASIAAEGRNDLVGFVTLDARLAGAAALEGFTVVGGD